MKFYGTSFLVRQCKTLFTDTNMLQMRMLVYIFKHRTKETNNSRKEELAEHIGRTFLQVLGGTYLKIVDQLLTTNLSIFECHTFL
jgi:hypothetical protein